MPPLIECVPNISEGRDPATLQAVAAAVRRVRGVSLLHIDAGASAHRSVFTFVGPPEAVAEGAVALIREAAARIDMRHHRGAHPRIGAADVCPFVPLEGASMAECIDLARQVGARVANELGLPVYLYGEAARRADRRDLSRVRAGQFEGLAARMATPEGAPDHGPYVPGPAGAVAVGARPVLVALNVNLNTLDRRKAARIAARVREAGGGAGGGGLGLLRAVRAIGWTIEEYRRCQVSMNLLDWTITPPHAAVEVVRRLAEREGVLVTGAELVGMIPLEAMRAAGRHYLRRQGLNPGASDAELVEIAAQSMGLRDVRPFEAREQVLEWRMQPEGPLVGGTMRGAVEALASARPTPGGGAAAALCGALAAALAAMVAQVSTGRPGHGLSEAELAAIAQEAQALKDACLLDVDADAEAYRALLAAGRGDGERREAALRHAIEVPLGCLERAPRILAASARLLAAAPQARADARSAVAICQASARACWHSVLANLDGLQDDAERSAYRLRADAALREVEARCAALRDPRMPPPAPARA